MLHLTPQTRKHTQAAGRMRLLLRGQKLHFAGTQEISDKIWRLVSSSSSSSRSTPFLTSHHVLQWVMANTVASLTGGVIECKKGVHYAATHQSAA